MDDNEFLRLMEDSYLKSERESIKRGRIIVAMWLVALIFVISCELLIS